jgi:hypothetical protein
MDGTLTIVVSGMVAGVPRLGGASWAVLQYVLGLRALGHRVILIEPVDDEQLAQPEITTYFRRIVDEFGLRGNAALVSHGGSASVGIRYDELRRAAENANVVLNISGMLRDEQLTGAARARVYVDLDPAFNQLWHAVEGIDIGLYGHTHFATVGQAIGTERCAVPDCGVEWVAILPPVMLERWPPASVLAHDAFTSVGHWRGYGSIEHDGVLYGQRAHSLRDLMRLPSLAGERFLLALAIHPEETADLEALEEAGWELVDPGAVALTPGRYADFVRGSKAELGIAKSGYVQSRCGWFSDRSACYLASGRPVVAQDTAFDRFLPTGEGLLSFATAEEAAACVRDVHTDYGRHARAARAIAERHLDSRTVLTGLLRAVGVDA